MESRRTKGISRRQALKRFLNTDNVEKEFFFRGRSFSEKLAKYPKIIYREAVSESLTQKPFLDTLPKGKNGIFSLRIDVDEVLETEFEKYLELFSKYRDCVTLFCCCSAFKGKEGLLEKARDLSLDIQSHGYYHYVFNDYDNNLHNLNKAKIFFENLDIHTQGFAAPMGKYNSRLILALENLGYRYSSDFSFDYVNLPHYPKIGARAAKVLEIPIFPVCPELLFDTGLTLEEVKNYYDQVISKLRTIGLPVIIYAHTNKHCEKVRGFLKHLLAKVSQDSSLYRCSLASFYELFSRLGNVRITANLGSLDEFLLGKSKKIGFCTIFKRNLKNVLDFEEIVPAEELVGNTLKKYVKLLVRAIKKITRQRSKE